VQRVAEQPLANVQAVVVTWADTFDYRDETWLDFPLDLDKLRPPTMRTIGYLVCMTDTLVVVCGTVDVESEKVSTVSVIPKGCIITITTL
jgi:hypothetical protein